MEASIFSMGGFRPQSLITVACVESIPFFSSHLLRASLIVVPLLIFQVNGQRTGTQDFPFAPVTQSLSYYDVLGLTQQCSCVTS